MQNIIFSYKYSYQHIAQQSDKNQKYVFKVDTMITRYSFWNEFNNLMI